MNPEESLEEIKALLFETKGLYCDSVSFMSDPDFNKTAIRSRSEPFSGFVRRPTNGAPLVSICFGIVSLMVALLVCSCQSPTRDHSGSLPPPPNPARAHELLPEELSQASAVYTSKCAKCHKFYNPADYRRVEWDSWMRKMSRKAKLTPEQKSLLTKYLETFRPLDVPAP